MERPTLRPSRVIPGILPPGGWHYVHIENGQIQYRIPHVSELPSLNAVVDAITHYRLENRLPVGDPQGDYENWLCSTHPRFCREHLFEANHISANLTAPAGQRHVDRINGWANSLYAAVPKLKMVPMAEADQRAQTCLQCPLNVQWEGECPACVTSAQRLLLIIRQGRDSHYGKKLHACSGTGMCTRTAIHIEREHFPPQSTYASLPEPCWLKK
jgi:hypothetical protein